ncbi:6621_t:CDS:1 [Ambispora leptoticha]|uniref:6621_t:CDS:1 n=1 Tax=Ambispora leptoticha TaxID=144679 RepID=A0A9N9IDT7_9GLOM|nr:6621_t:CDS:1 [Ambispora leptoticha]
MDLNEQTIIDKTTIFRKIYQLLKRQIELFEQPTTSQIITRLTLSKLNLRELVKTKEFFSEQEESYQQKLEKLINLEGQEYKQKVINLIEKAQQVAQDESRKNPKTQQYQKITWVKNCKACDYCAKYKKKCEYQNNQKKCNWCIKKNIECTTTRIDSQTFKVKRTKGQTLIETFEETTAEETIEETLKTLFDHILN